MEKIKILVVEDERIIAKDIQNSLENLGYIVLGVAASGEEALKKVEELRPDMAIIDIVLEGETDGIEVATEFQSRFNIPVIYLTAHEDDNTLERAKITEPFGYITKPFEEKELRIAIRMALYKHKMETERKELIQQLQLSLAKIQTLSGLLPICASCKKIRDDKGYWNQLERYIQDHSHVEFTHGICPECMLKLYPELYIKDDGIQNS